MRGSVKLPSGVMLLIIKQTRGLYCCRYSPLCIDAATVMLGIAEGRSSVFKVLGSAEQQAASAAQTKEKAANAMQSAQKSEPVIAKTKKK